MESSKETGYQAQEGPILCINNCGFFGSPTTMNMCSKCHKDMILKEQQAKYAASSIEHIINGKDKSPILADPVNAEGQLAILNVAIAQPATIVGSSQNLEVKPKEGPNRCNTCRKRVGLTGFECRCGHLFCSVHRYSDKHDCQFDYRSTGRDAIAKANPVVKAEKLGKI